MKTSRSYWEGNGTNYWKARIGTSKNIIVIIEINEYINLCRIKLKNYSHKISLDNKFFFKLYFGLDIMLVLIKKIGF